MYFLIIFTQFLLLSMQPVVVLDRGGVPVLNDSCDQPLEGAVKASLEIPESYRFDVAMHLNMDVNGQISEVVWHFEKEGRHIGMEQKAPNGLKVFMITDYERQLSLVLTDLPDGKKQGTFYEGLANEMDEVTYSQDGEEDWYGDEEESEDSPEDDENASITKTGKSKTIAGYKCLEYQIKTGSEENTVWAAPDFPVKWSENYSEYFIDFSGEEKDGVRMLEGMPMEIFGTSMEDGEIYQLHSLVTKVVLDRWTLRTGDYDFSE